MITLGLTQGQRGRRAVEVALGVTLGIAVADLLVIELGTGLVAARARGRALDDRRAAARLRPACSPSRRRSPPRSVATLQPPDGGVSFARAVDALIGGGVALAVSALVLPAHPGRMVREAAGPVLAELAGVLDDVAAALRSRDREAVARRAAPRPGDRRPRPRARGRARRRPRDRAADPAALAHARDGRRLRRRRRPDRPRRAQRPRAGPRRPARDRPGRERPARALRRAPSSSAPRSARCAARSRIRAAPRPSARPALRAAGRATRVLERTGNLSVSVIVGQVRSTAVDLLRGTGLSYEEATVAVRAAVREAEAEEASCPARRAPAQPGWQAGHQYVVRPPTTPARHRRPAARAVPVAAALGDHLARVDAAQPDRRARRRPQLAAQQVELVLRQRRPRAAGGRAARATASRRPAGCRPRRSRPGRAAAP